jgi:hypothetical protein
VSPRSCERLHRRGPFASTQCVNLPDLAPHLAGLFFPGAPRAREPKSTRSWPVPDSNPTPKVNVFTDDVRLPEHNLGVT